jgi:hypothetical protein
MKSRNIYLVSALTVLFILALVGAGIGLAAYGPARPGHAIYPLQQWAEDIQVRLARDEDHKIELLLNLAHRRHIDLQRQAGAVFEPIAARNLEEAIEEASSAILALDETEGRAYWAELRELVQAAQSTLAHLPDLPFLYPKTYHYLQTSFEQVINRLAAKGASTEHTTRSTLASGLFASPSLLPFHILAGTWMEDVLPVVSGERPFDPHVLDGRCSSCHNFAGACTPCHQGDQPAFHYEFECSACHRYEDWRWVEVDHLAFGFFECSTCHLDQRPAGHYAGECSTCHAVTGWSPANFAHTLMGNQTCSSCHSQQSPPGHYQLECSNCHNPIAWLPVWVNHSSPALADCMLCHQQDQPAGHFNLQCSYCHTPSDWGLVQFNHNVLGSRECSTCHSNVIPQDHYNASCAKCHNTRAWLPAQFDHSAVNTSNCFACHMDDAPANHYTLLCSSCHNTNSWSEAVFNHVIMNATDCIACHSADAPSNHFSGQCSNCHSTSAWLPATFDHAAYGATDCVACHSGDAPTALQLPQTSACCRRPSCLWGDILPVTAGKSLYRSNCHSTSAWLPATFDHAAYGATDCVACHSADAPRYHFSGQCSNCHSTSAWLPADFNHDAYGASDCRSCHSGDAPADHYPGQCSDCHTSTSTWKVNHEGLTQCNTCHEPGKKRGN